MRIDVKKVVPKDNKSLEGLKNLVRGLTDRKRQLEEQLETLNYNLIITRAEYNRKYQEEKAGQENLFGDNKDAR